MGNSDRPLGLSVSALGDRMLGRARHALARCLLTGGILGPVLAVDGFTSTPKEGAGQVSAGPQPYWVEQVAAGLNFPSSMVWLPSGEMLITERMGGLRRLRHGQLEPQPVRGTPATFQSIYDGLKDILLDPDYPANQTLYLLVSEGTFAQHHAAVYRARYSAAGLTNVERIFRSKDAVGGPTVITARMLFLADKTLLVAVAEDHKQGAQQLGSHLGKILRINRDGSIPPDNPFVKTPGALPEIWSYGHRVPLGLYQERATGVVWEVESGPRGGDELNVLKAGGNYGWAKASWGFAYNNSGLDAPVQSGPGIEDPLLVWTPSVTPSGLTRYRGRVYPEWEGDYFLGHLTTKALERLRIRGRRVVLQERLLLDLEERIRDVKVGPDNHLYVLTDHQQGRLLRLQPGRPRAPQLARVARKLEQTWLSPDHTWIFPRSDAERAAMEPGDPMKGRQAFLERCAGCHRVGTVVRGGELGPDLAGVYGRPIGRQTGFEYSPTMADSPFIWNFVTLNRFLANPGGVMPGTKMAAPPVTDPEVRRQIVGFLKQQSGK